MPSRQITAIISLGLFGVVFIFGFLLYASEEYHQEKLSLEKDQITLIKSFMLDVKKSSSFIIIIILMFS
jgi:hypothetical protein